MGLQSLFLDMLLPIRQSIRPSLLEIDHTRYLVIKYISESVVITQTPTRCLTNLHSLYVNKINTAMRRCEKATNQSQVLHWRLDLASFGQQHSECKASMQQCSPKR